MRLEELNDIVVGYIRDYFEEKVSPYDYRGNKEVEDYVNKEIDNLCFDVVDKITDTFHGIDYELEENEREFIQSLRRRAG